MRAPTFPVGGLCVIDRHDTSGSPHCRCDSRCRCHLASGAARARGDHRHNAAAACKASHDAYPSHSDSAPCGRRVRGGCGFTSGPLSRRADPAGVDLAAHVADGDEVDVPRIGESEKRTTTARRSPSRARARTRKSKSKSVPTVPVDINVAGTAALATVPGIGPAIAARIVELREREGAYTSFDELLDVAGMSPARLDRARSYLALKE